MLHNQHSRVDNSFRGISPGNVFAVALTVCLMMGFFEDLHAASISPQALNQEPTTESLAADKLETHTADIIQTPAGFPYRRKREAKCPALVTLFKKGPEADALLGMKELDLNDARYAGVCRMQFKIHGSPPGAVVPMIFDASCTCAFYAKNAAVAAAHCFKEATSRAKTGKFTVTVVPLYKKDDVAGNKAREMGVVDFWYPKAFQQPVVDGKTITQDPTSGHDITFFRTDKEVAETAVYTFATPDQVKQYHGKIGSVQTIGYPKAFEKSQVAVKIQGTLHPLDGELTNQIALQDEKLKSCIGEGGSGGPWFLSQDSLDLNPETKNNDAVKNERKKWILGINGWVGALTPITVGPIITPEYVAIGKAVAEGKGEQHKSTGVYAKAADHKP